MEWESYWSANGLSPGAAVQRNSDTRTWSRARSCVRIIRKNLRMRARRRNRQQDVEQRPVRIGALERQQAPPGDQPAMGRHLLGIAAVVQHAVARHDDHEGI